MRGISVICLKELKSLFTGPIFYVVSLLMTAMMSFNFYLTLKFFSDRQGAAAFSGMESKANIHYEVFIKHLSIVNLIFIFLIPALTMKLLSEERKLKTFDLLLTSPVTSAEIVIGKYLATLVAVFALMCLALVYPLATRYVTAFSWAPLFISFFGIFLLAAVYAAMSLFCSSLTEQSLIAFVMSVVLNIVLWFLGMGAEVADSQLARQIYEHVSLNTHLSALVQGTIRTNSIIFFLSFIAFFIFLTERVVESFRWRSL
jgi:ABC-2 type transport system permease protein